MGVQVVNLNPHSENRPAIEIQKQFYFLMFLLIVIVYIYYLNKVFLKKNKYRPVFSINPETPDFHFSWFKQFSIQAWMKGIFFEKIYLLFKFCF